MTQFINPSLYRLSEAEMAQLPNDPSVLQAIPLTVGILYIFQEVGVVLPTHDHSDSNIHYTVILSGQFTVTTQSAGDTTVNAGDILDFSPNDPHSFTCVQPGQILNAQKVGTSLTSLTSTIAKIQTELTSVNATLASLPAMVTQVSSDVAALNSTTTN